MSKLTSGPAASVRSVRLLESRGSNCVSPPSECRTIVARCPKQSPTTA